MPNELLMRPLRFDDLNKEQGWYQISLGRHAQNTQPPPSICIASERSHIGRPSPGRPEPSNCQKPPWPSWP